MQLFANIKTVHNAIQLKQESFHCFSVGHGETLQKTIAEGKDIDGGNVERLIKEFDAEEKQLDVQLSELIKTFNTDLLSILRAKDENGNLPISEANRHLGIFKRFTAAFPDIEIELLLKTKQNFLEVFQFLIAQLPAADARRSQLTFQVNTIQNLNYDGKVNNKLNLFGPKDPKIKKINPARPENTCKLG